MKLRYEILVSLEKKNDNDINVLFFFFGYSTAMLVTLQTIFYVTVFFFRKPVFISQPKVYRVQNIKNKKKEVKKRNKHSHMIHQILKF